jgi:AcrR family transcriptional regulator
MPRRTGEETRRLLIDTGIDMLHERGVTVGVSHIRLQEVVKRAGLTTGAAYRLWDDQERFHRELAVAFVRWRAEDPVGRTSRAVAHLVEEGAPLAEVVRVAAAAHIAGLGDVGGAPRPGGSVAAEDAAGPGPGAGAGEGQASEVDTFLTTLALRAGARHGDELQRASRERHAGSIDRFAGFYTTLMAAYDMRMRAPFTVRHFAVMVAALGEGFALHAIEGEDHPVVRLPAGHGGCRADDSSGTDSPADWSLFGVAVAALVDATMEPCTPAGGDK